MSTRTLGLALALLLPGTLAACSQEDPIDAAAAEREMVGLAGVREADGGCHDKDLWGRECTVRVTLQKSAASDEITEVLERLREYADEDATLTVSMEDVPAIQVRVVDETEPDAGGRVIAAAAAEPTLRQLGSSFTSPLRADLSVDSSLGEAVELTRELLGEGAWAATLTVEDPALAPSVRAQLEDGEDLTDEVTLVESVAGRYPADAVSVEDDAVQITLVDPDDDAAARTLAESLTAYDGVESVEIGALAPDATLERRVEVAIEQEFADVVVSEGGFLQVKVPNAARVAVVDRFLVDELGDEFEELQLTYWWRDGASVHRPVNPVDGFDFGLTERLSLQAWEEIEVEMPSEVGDRGGYRLSGGRRLSPHEAGRLLALARADDQDLTVYVSGRYLDEFYYLTLDLSGDVPELTEGGDDGLDELLAGWQQGVEARG